MALVKQDHVLEKAVWAFDETGDVSGLELTVNIEIFDNVAEKELTRIREVKDVWGDLTAPQKLQGDAIGKKLKNLAEAF